MPNERKLRKKPGRPRKKRTRKFPTTMETRKEYMKWLKSKLK